MGGQSADGQPPHKRTKVYDCSRETTEESLTNWRGAGSQLGAHTVPSTIAKLSFGAADSTMAGKASSSSAASLEKERIGSKGQIRTQEFVRLLTQALYSLGYHDAATKLEEESGIPLQSRAVTAFRNGILEGSYCTTFFGGERWDSCVQLLARMRLEEEDHKQAQFLILQQRFLELLEDGSTLQALQVLRGSLAPLGINTNQLHLLATCVMCTTPEDLMKTVHWTGSAVKSRFRLLVNLQALIPPSILIPERRLEKLVEQALQAQREHCELHNTFEEAFSLFADHKCGRDEIPSRTSLVLDAHTDEVWYLQFSHDGKRLASASKDQSVIIWEIECEDVVLVQHRLQGHTKPLSFVAWSPDDSLLLTCGNDELVKLWDTATGTCKHTYEKHTQAVTACAWCPDGGRFVSGGLDRCMFMWDTAGNEIESWRGPRMPRINDLAISEDGKHMVSICSEKEIRIHNFEDKTDRTIEEEKSITSLCMSSDGRYILVNLSSQEIHLWDLGRKKHPDLPTCKYRGQKQGRFVIRSCFGGSNQAFIVSGSEDSQIYIWHRETEELLEVLAGHSGTVNAVSWNPANPHMFASASDDHTIRAGYDPAVDLLGPRFSIKGRRYQRLDFELKNDRGHTLKCSHYSPVSTSGDSLLPCVIYCHGNSGHSLLIYHLLDFVDVSGCRADANEAAIILLPSNITVLALDFAGSGLSDGEYVSLGCFEMEDLATVIKHLREEGRTSLIGLWGRSMGAVTSLLYVATDPTVAGVVMDSPFSRLSGLMLELVDLYKIPLPKFTVKMAVQYMRSIIKKKAHFDITALDAIAAASKCFVPALFGHAEDDDFILPHHSDDICAVYAGDKNLIKFEGDHNSVRPSFYYDSIAIFFHNVLCPPPAPGVVDDTDDHSFDFEDELDQATVYEVLTAMERAGEDCSAASADTSATNESPGNQNWEDLKKLRRLPFLQVPTAGGEHKEEDEEDIKELLSPEGLSLASARWSMQDDSNGTLGLQPSDAEEEERMLMEAIEASLTAHHLQDKTKADDAAGMSRALSSESSASHTCNKH
eukprot:SM000177S03204  [mRNA]  locus=s177:210935:220262:- [translate_table: standard]